MDKARSTLQQIVAGAANHPLLLAEAYGELCLALDSAGEYDAAWEASLSCKRILLQHDASAWNAAQFILARCARMVEALDYRSLFSLADDAGRRRHPAPRGVDRLSTRRHDATGAGTRFAPGRC